MNTCIKYLVLLLMVVSLSFVSPSYTWNPFSKRLRYLNSENKPRSYRDASNNECKIYDLKIIECNIQVSRLGNQKISAEYKKTCNLKKTTITFYISSSGKYSIAIVERTPEIRINEIKKNLEERKLFLAPGTHKIFVKLEVVTMKNEEMTSESDECTFYVNHEKPTPSLGRLKKNVMNGTKFVVTAKGSINNDLGKNDGLEYRWNCTDTAGFCDGRDLGTGGTITVGEEYAKLGANFTFILEVRTQYSEWQKCQQFIYVNPSRPFVINCISRCGKEPYKFDPHTTPVIIAECQFNCDQYDVTKVSGLISYVNEKQDDVMIKKFAVGPLTLNNFAPNSRIKLIAFYDQNKTNILAEEEFSSYPNPKLQKCKSIPKSGNPLTKFKIECTYDADQVQNFEIEVNSHGTVAFSTTSEKLEDVELVIPSESKVTVKLRDINGVQISKTLHVKIDPILKNTNNVTTASENLNEIFEGKREGSKNVDNMIAEGNYTNAVQIIDVVARELSNIPVKDKEAKEMVGDLKKKLLNSLSKLPVDNVDMLKSVSGVISLIASQNADNISESNMALKLGQICSGVAKKQLYLLENDVGDYIKEKDVVSTTNNLLKCGESEMVPYYEIFDELPQNIEISTEYPIRDDLSENNIEEYPEYVADDLIEGQVQNFLEAAEHVVDICRDLGKSLILASTLYNEKPTYVERNDTIVGIFKSTGMNIAGSKFHQHNVTVIVSTFMEKIDAIFSVRVCTYKNDPFWSFSKTMKIDTNVVDLSITNLVEESVVTEFGTKPMNISFGVVQENVGQKTFISVDFLNHTITDYPEDNFIIFIFKTKAMEAFFVEFYDLDKLDDISAVLIDMERPVLNQFSVAYRITKTNSRLFIENQVDEDKWFLLGLKRKTNASLQRISTNFSVYTIKCITWDSSNSTWQKACKIDAISNNEMIYCGCSHLSTIAGSLEYNDIREHPKFISVKFVLEENNSLHICIMVCVTVGLYFILLVYANKKTEEHVLNFPDPFLELMQRNQNDMFALATSKHLGQLTKIHLWFDFTGTSPNWYCDEVKICDLQKKKWYTFKVKRWLKVDKQPKVFLNVPVDTSKRRPATDHDIRNRLERIALSLGEFKNTLFSPPTIDESPSFGRPKRITLILSIVLTLMVLLMLFHGRPEMALRDAITPKCYYELDWNTLYVGIYSAIITFVPHTALMVGFKKSRLQYDSRHERTCPFLFGMMCWCILITNVFIQIHFLLIYGYWVVPPTTWHWTTSLLVALFFYIFVLDYIYHMILMSAGTIIRHGQMNYNKILKNVEKQRQFLYKRFGGNIFRPIMTPLYEVMNKANYLRKYNFFRQKREILYQIQDLTMIIFFIFFLYVIIMEERNTTYDVLAHEEALLLLQGHDNIRLRLQRVNEIDEFESWLSSSFIPNLQSYQWYGRYVSETPGLTTDSCNRYLGIIRLRQLRAELIGCNITNLMQFINRTCSSTRYITHFDYLNYTPSWNETISEHHKSRLGYVWGYQEATGESHLGVSGYYQKGGYIALLGRTMKNSLVNFAYLRRYGWMNLLTRAIFIEFPLYNVNMNLFNFATIMLEKTPSGYIYKSATVKPLRMLTETSESTKVSSSFTVLFMGLVFLITVRTFVRIIKTKVWYKRDLWNVVDVGIISLSIAWIVMYFRKIGLLKYFVKELEEQRSNTFVDYFDLIAVESWMRILASILICAITVRVWRLLRFATVFRTVERTLAYSFESLMYCFAYFLICCTGFGVMGFILFCTTSSHFKDGISTAKSLILMTIGMRGPKTLRIDQKNSSLSYVFIVLFYCFSYFLTTIFIAIILVNFVRAQQFSFEETLEYNMKDYTKEKIISLKRMARMWARKFRLKAGGNENQNEEVVTPKSNDIRYMNCVSVDSNRMRAMKSVANCLLSRKTKGTMFNKFDHVQMMKTVRNLCNKKKGRDEFFFVQDNKTSGCSLIDNRRLLMIEEVVKRMLESPEKRAARLKKIEENESLRAENLAKIEMMNYRLKIMLKILTEISVKIETR